MFFFFLFDSLQLNFASFACIRYMRSFLSSMLENSKCLPGPNCTTAPPMEPALRQRCVPWPAARTSRCGGDAAAAAWLADVAAADDDGGGAAADGGGGDAAAAAAGDGSGAAA